MSQQNQFIVIEGNIGAGKTSLCQKLAKEKNSKLILEQFSDNPFLPLFYQNPDRYAFTVELFFMTERHKQLQELLSTGDLFSDSIIADYIFTKTLLFAGHNLEGEELRLFQTIFNTLNAAFPKPEKLFYLHRPVDELINNIRKRNRDYEQQIRPEYLQKIQNSYFEFFKIAAFDIPVIIIDVSQLNFIDKEKDYNQVKYIIEQNYSVGLHRCLGSE